MGYFQDKEGDVHKVRKAAFLMAAFQLHLAQYMSEEDKKEVVMTEEKVRERLNAMNRELLGEDKEVIILDEKEKKTPEVQSNTKVVQIFGMTALIATGAVAGGALLTRNKRQYQQITINKKEPEAKKRKALSDDPSGSFTSYGS
jgi:hypothetical protein